MKVKTITCPNCGQANNFLAEDCLQCGINFSKYYEDLEKAEALRLHIEAQEKAEAQRKREQAEKAEILRRQKEELERAEAQKRAEEEARRQAEEEARRKAEEDARRQAEEEARRKAEEDARRQAEEESRRKAEEDARRQAEEEASRKAEEDARRQAEEDARRQAEEEAERRKAAAAALSETAEAEDDTLQPVPLSPATSMTERLSQLLGQTVGVCFGNPAEIVRGKIIAVHSDHFQLLFLDSRHIASCPLRTLAMVVEHNEGLSAEGPDVRPVFPAVLQLTRPFFLRP